MEEILESREKLLQQLSTLETASDEFLHWYIKQNLQSNDYPSGNNRSNKYEPVYLPYQGNDFSFILRLFKDTITRHKKDFIIDQTNEKAIEYLAGIVAGTVKKQGIILHGGVGSGKTLLLIVWTRFRQRLLNQRVLMINNYKGYREIEYCYFTPSDLTRLFIKHGYSLFEKDFGEILILDDIGISTEGNYYGTKTNILEEIIFARYESFKRNNGLELYCSTNLLSTQLAEVIGDRAYSRLLEMVEWNDGAILASDRRQEEHVMEWPKIWTKDIFKQYSY